jgi:hypothetical protein
VRPSLTIKKLGIIVFVYNPNYMGTIDKRIIDYSPGQPRHKHKRSCMKNNYKKKG